MAEELKNPTVEMAAAALLHGLVHDHPFYNGNKRTALVSMLVFMDENGMLLTCDEGSLFKLVLQLAQHAIAKGPRHELPDREVLAVTRIIRRSARLMEKGDRALPWRQLNRILAAHGCEFSFPATGNRINIQRRVRSRTRWLGRPKEVTLKIQTFYGSDGREVDRTAINRIRRELYLDDDHGVDSAAFYDDASITASEFITRYRKTLRRLARL
jgi:death-on-curing protein